MIDPASGIDYVTLQSTRLQGLDDVEVRYADGRLRCIQVKHTRVEDSLTFGDLVDGGLLRELASAWKESVEQGERCIPELVTNRSVGRRGYTPAEGGVLRPALSKFWPYLKGQLEGCADIGRMAMPTDWTPAWESLLEQLEELQPEQQLDFLHTLEIRWDAPGLIETAERLRLRLTQLFRCTEAQAEELLGALDHSLRSWTTTTRRHARITQESVYAALGLPTEAPGTNHLIAPPEPFFPSRFEFTKQVADRIRGDSLRVLFLSGSPGCGKTSIVSFLATRREPIVDARFHAYRPITPDTQHLPPDADLDVSPAGLWGNLLSQLRHYLRNRLATYSVPVRNRFLAPDQLRAEVLRIAHEIGGHRGTPFVIAVDGIDHAARSSEPAARALLQSLPEPEQIPANVRLLVAGQPPEAWREYPLWLHETPAGLERVDVPAIGDADIRALVTARCQLPPEQLQVVAQLISDASHGDTLAAVFAAEEARLSSGPDDLSLRLRQRNLHSGVRAYYDRIWESVSARLHEIGPFSAYRVGAVLALFDQRVTPERVNDIFNDSPLSNNDWFEALLLLRPLVVQEASGFRLAHNDVRMYLAAKLRAEPQRLVLAAAKIADYCRTNQRAGRSRFTLTFPMLVLAQRQAERAAMFDSSYVVAAWREGIALGFLQDQAKEALGVLASLDGAWETLHSVTCALITISQIDRSTDFAQFSQEALDAPIEPNMPLPALVSECHVSHVSRWTSATIDQVLNDVLRLLPTDRARGRGLFRRWFAGVTPPQLAQHVRAATDNVQPEALNAVVRRFGEAVWRCGLGAVYGRPPIEAGTESEWATFVSGLLDGAQSQSPIAWGRALQSMRRYWHRDVEEDVTALAEREYWIHVALSLRELTSRREKFSTLFQVRAAAWSLLLGYEDLITAWTIPILNAPFKHSQEFSDWSSVAEIAVATSFLLGWKTVRPVEGIREDALSTPGGRWGSDTQRGVSFLCYAAATIGRWFGLRQCPLADAQLEKFLYRLLEGPSGWDAREAQTRLATLLFRLAMDAARRDETKFAIVRKVVNGFVSRGQHGSVTPYLWRVLSDEGDVAPLRDWITKRFGQQGQAWSNSTDGRVAEIETFERLASATGLHDEARTLARLKRSVVLGYVNHKEYVLAYPLDWYRKLLPSRPGIWCHEGLRLLALSAEADTAGDNRRSTDVDAAVTASAALCGPASMRSLDEALRADGKRWFELNSRHWIDGLLTSIPHFAASIEDLRAMWSLSIGQLSWRYQRDIDYLAEAQEGFSVLAERLGLQGELTQLETAAQLEWTVARDHVRSDKVRRWIPFEYQPNDADNAIADSIVDRPLSDVIGEFETLVRRGDTSIWFVTQLLARRLMAEQPADIAALAWFLFDTANRARTMSDTNWNFDGLQQAFKLLLTMMSPERQWDVVRSIIGRVERRANYSPAFLADDLDNCCMAVSSLDQTLDRLRRHLDTQTEWVPTPRELDTPRIESVEPGLDWPHYALDGLLAALSSDSALLNLSSMRGLAALVRLVPRVIGALLQKTPSLRRSDQEVIAQLAEHLASNDPATFIEMRSFLDELSASGCLELELQAWIAKSATAKVRGEELPALVLAPPISRPSRIVSGSRIVVRDGRSGRAAESTTGLQAVASVLRQLLAVSNVDTPAIEAAFLASLDVTPLTSPERPHRARGSDLEFADTGHLERLMDVIRSGVHGNIPREFATRLAQALLHQDEPGVIFGNWGVGGMWPSDDTLKAAVDSGREPVRSLLGPILNTGLAADQRVFAGMLHVCTREVDIFVYVLPLLRDSDTRITARPDASTIGGRMFAFTEESRFDRYEGDPPPRWLAYKGRGLSRTPHQNFGVTIGSLVQQQGEWTFESATPPTWLAGDRSSVYYERLHGPRRYNVQERTFRDPFVERWVCTQTALDDLEKRLGGTVTLTTEIEITGEESREDDPD
ncbi:MAG: ATP-binding protein [Kofleriaceae bacterium]